MYYIFTFFTYIFSYYKIIRKNQEGYYIAIQNCNNAGNSNEFIEFMLGIIDEAVDGMIIEQKETTQETTQENYTVLNETQQNIIKLIKNKPSITQKEIAKELNITRDGVKYNINALKELGIVEREGSTKKGSWKIVK